VEWNGGVDTGSGVVSVQSGALSAYPYGFHSRFGEVRGTNPEELLGAAHAACYTMALGIYLEQVSFPARALQVTSRVTLSGDPPHLAISKIVLTVDADLPDASNEIFQRLAFEALQRCPISQLVKIEVDLRAALTRL
jgi:osmotically inducible protein OsmC